MSMKIKSGLMPGLMLMLLIMFGLGSCKPAGVSIEERMKQFQYDLNNDRDSLYLNLHPCISTYNALKDPALWEAKGFTADAYNPQSFSGMSINGDTVTGTWTRNTLGPRPFRCKLQENGDEGWFIIQFQVDNDGNAGNGFELTLLP